MPLALKTGLALGVAGVSLLGIRVAAGALLAGEPNGLAISAADDSMVIRDGLTSANNYVGTPQNKLTVTRASTAMYWSQAGVLTQAANNVLRRDFDPRLGGAWGYLLEEARTNVLLRNTDYTVAPWADAGTGASTKVDGGLVAGFATGLITATSANGGIRQSCPGLTNGIVYTVSFYLASTETTCAFVLENGAASYGTFCSSAINAVTGVISAVSGFTRTASRAFGAGFIYEFVLPAAGGTLIATPSWRVATNGIAFRIGFAQLEAGVFATSHIPTAAIAVARVLDLPTLAGTLFPINLAEVTLYARYVSITTQAAVRHVFQIYKASTGNSDRVTLYNSSSDRMFCAVGGAAQVDTSGGGVVVALTSVKLAARFKQDDFAVSRNGAAIVADVSGGFPTNIDTMAVGTGSSSGSLSGWLMEAMYLPRALSNAQLMALTA